MLERVGFAGELDLVGYSDNVWRGVDFRDLAMRPNYGTYEWDHFTNPAVTLTGRSTTTNATSGTLAHNNEANGVVRISTGAATDGQGVTSCQFAQSSTGAHRHYVPSVGRMCFEARVKLGGAGTPGAWFVGVAPTNTSIVSGATPAITTSTQYIGFYGLDSLTITGQSRKSSSVTANTATLGSLVDSTWIKLGIVIENAAKARLYVNGELKDTLATNIHDGFVIPTFGLIAAGSVTSTLDIDWYGLACVNLIQ